MVSFVNFFSIGLEAAQVTGLYKTELPIDSQSADEQKTAMGKALGKVIVKVTGEVLSLANNTLKSAIAQPELYLNSYSYRKSSTKPKQQYLQITFIEEQVNRLLRNAGLAIWGSDRPTILAWLAVDDGRNRNIQRDNFTGSIVEAFEQQFRERALPLIFPLYDVEDVKAVSMADVWGVFPEKLLTASKRYGADAILAGRLEVKDGLYNGRLSLFFRETKEDADILALDSQQLSQAAADLVGGTLSQHYAIISLDSRENTTFSVEGVKSVQDYSNLLTYLEGLTAVRSISVRRLLGSNVELELMFDGYSSQLTDAIALGRNLRAVKKAQGEHITQEGPVMFYRWIGR
ncbi:MAG: DUF2066 domain-containing protein [Candidatus Endonucleobacter bathymodioli]|uniref:DUF2066 domain-containing protein n=1 Tax=Candidatus Endonucleibacter bathymodioli TaxID=539814 RepID=A0AA90NKI8_9GAMM|nr:DUF2066 domain-containing protein [Candidatus Endonucleobacter bathymodioli]